MVQLALLAIGFVLASSGLAHADSPRPEPLKHGTPVSIQGYGRQNPACREWTNGCVLCAADKDGTSQCSTPGIACVPAGLTCKRMSVP